VSRGSREVGSPHYPATFDDIAESLLESGLEVYGQGQNSTFLTRARINQREKTICNIIGVRAGLDPRLSSLILSTHFDSRTNTTGTDDVSVMLELVHSARPRAELIFVFLGSEHGVSQVVRCVGANWWRRISTDL
jgi:hypothetical protein